MELFIDKTQKSKQRKMAIFDSHLLNHVGSRESLCLRVNSGDNQSVRRQCLWQRFILRLILTVFWWSFKTSEKPVPSSKYGNSWSSPQTAVIVLVSKRRCELLSNYLWITIESLASHFRSASKQNSQRNFKKEFSKEPARMREHLVESKKKALFFSTRAKRHQASRIESSN